ncbi:MAG: IS630 family transposase [Candidatus Nitrosocosmicus sp.]|nr:IS630 family transposase [Candidatus Nitrosocosmicus sp.]
MYRAEKDVKIKERMLLVINVVYYDKIAAQVSREIHRSRGWACQWLKRFEKEGIEGLKDIPKSGRKPDLPEEIEYEIREILKEDNSGWTTKQVEELIIRESGIRYHPNHIYRVVKKWGLKQKVPRKVHVNTASKEEKEEFKKKKTEQILDGTQYREENFDIISLDESFFFCDTLVRRVWIDAKKRPVVRITGSHKYSCLFGAVSMNQKQLFRHYNKFNTETFLDFLEVIHTKFPKCYLFMDKASPHYKSRRVKDYLEENKNTLIPMYLPTASPEFMMLEEVWNIAKRESCLY